MRMRYERDIDPPRTTWFVPSYGFVQCLHTLTNPFFQKREIKALGRAGGFPRILLYGPPRPAVGGLGANV